MTSEFGFEPGRESTAVLDNVTTRAGDPQLRRTWEADQPRGVVLIVHGIAEHSGRYEHVARQLVDRGFSVVAFDQRSHGATGGGEGGVKSFADFHDDLEDRFDDLRSGGAPVVMLGHSMGGLVVAGYVLDARRPQPDLVVLSAPALAAQFPSVVRRLIVLVAKMIPKVRVKLPLDEQDLSHDPRVGEAYLADPDVHLRQPLGLVGALVAAVEDFGAGVDAWPADALVVHGTGDKIVPVQASEPLGRDERVARRTYEDLRHEMLNEPEGPEIVDDIVSWIDIALTRD